MVSSAPGPVYQAISALPLPALPASVAKWVPGESPFSTNKEVVSALAVYLAVIFGGQYLMSDRKAFSESLLPICGAVGERKGGWDRARLRRDCSAR